MSDNEVNPESLPVIPDAIARKLDKGQDVAVEELREAALDNINSGRANPVHMENLRPISKAEAATRTTFNGDVLPSMPATRRVIPRPFQRPRINADRHGKVWETARADEVEEGAIVPEIGEVVQRADRVRYVPRERIAEAGRLRGTILGYVPGDSMVAIGTSVFLTGAGGVTREFDAADQVRVFRRPLTAVSPAEPA